jgi:hypothetical protein
MCLYMCVCVYVCVYIYLCVCMCVDRRCIRHVHKYADASHWTRRCGCFHTQFCALLTSFSQCCTRHGPRVYCACVCAFVLYCFVRMYVYCFARLSPGKMISRILYRELVAREFNQTFSWWNLTHRFARSHTHTLCLLTGICAKKGRQNLKYQLQRTRSTSKLARRGPPWE